MHEILHWGAAALVGLVAGEIADRIMGRKHGMIVAMIIGLIGGLIGRYLIDSLHLLAMAHVTVPQHGIIHWAVSLAVSVVGALILIFVLGLFRSGKK